MLIGAEGALATSSGPWAMCVLDDIWAILCFPGLWGAMLSFPWKFVHLLLFNCPFIPSHSLMLLMFLSVCNLWPQFNNCCCSFYSTTRLFLRTSQPIRYTHMRMHMHEHTHAHVHAHSFASFGHYKSFFFSVHEMNWIWELQKWRRYGRI